MSCWNRQQRSKLGTCKWSQLESCSHIVKVALILSTFSSTHSVAPRQPCEQGHHKVKLFHGHEKNDQRWDTVTAIYVKYIMKK